MPRFLENLSRQIQSEYYTTLIKNKMCARAPSPLLCLCTDGFCEEDSPFHDYCLDSVIDRDPWYNMYKMPKEEIVREHWERTDYNIRRKMFSAARGLIREAVTDFAIDFVKETIPSVLVSCYGDPDIFTRHVREYLLTPVSSEGFYWSDQDEMSRPESHYKESFPVWDDFPEDLRCIDDEDIFGYSSDDELL